MDIFQTLEKGNRVAREGIRKVDETKTKKTKMT